MPPKPEEYRYLEGFGGGKVPMCGCKRVKCKDCKHYFVSAEKALDFCPECGTERYCNNPRLLDPNTVGLPEDQKKYLPCKVHGGYSYLARGAASGRFKTGRYSKHLPARLLEAYDASREDTEILSLNDDISLTEARVADVLQRVDSNESGAIWDELAKTAKDFKAAQRANNTVLVGELLNEMLALIAKGKGDRENWREVGDLLERKRKLSESQLKLLVTKQEFISRGQAIALISQLVEIFKSNIDDPVARRKVVSGVQQLMMMNEGQTVVETGGLRDLTK